MVHAQRATTDAIAVVGEALIDLIPVGGSGHESGPGRPDQALANGSSAVGADRAEADRYRAVPGGPPAIAADRAEADLYQAVPGGSPANVAVGLARLGVPVRMAARISGDPPGRILRRRLADAGVDMRAVVAASEPSSVALVSRGPHYDLRLHNTADWQWTESELQQIDPGSLAALHIGSLAAVLPPGAHEIAALVRRVRRTATITYDPNVRPEHMAAVPDARSRINALIGLADVVKLSDADLAWLSPGTSPAAFVKHLAATGTAVAVVTQGADGAVAACAAGVVHIPAVPVEVVDTVGAGDAYMSALLAGLHDRGLLGAELRAAELRDVDEPTLVAVLSDAASAAAVTCGRRGSDPPTRAELDGLAVVR